MCIRDSEKAGASCWSPRAWHMDGNFGLRAEDAAPRSFAPQPLRTADRSTHETRGQACWCCPLPVALQPRRGAIRASTTRPARSAQSQHAVTLPASRFASHSIAPQAASACPGTASAPSLVIPTSSEYSPGHTCGNRTPAKRGEAFWSCPLPVAQHPRRGADPSLNKQTCSLRATPVCSPIASLGLCK